MAKRVAPRLAASKLKVLVVDDSELASGFNLLRGEWAERSGGQLEILEWTTERLLEAEGLPADLIIYPSRFVGTMVDRGWVRPVRSSLQKSSDLDLDDLLPFVRNVALRYGQEVYALCLGESPLMVTGPPEGVRIVASKTWEQIGGALSKGESPLRYPLATELLVRGIASSRPGRAAAELFDAETLEPRINSLPYLKALKDMQAKGKPVGGERVPISIAWPNHSYSSSESRAYGLLPVAAKVFDPVREVWESQELKEPLAVYGFTGRSVSVTRATRNSASAFKFLGWIISEEISTQLSSRSESTLWFRKSQARKASRWLGALGGDDQSMAEVRRLLDSENFWLLARIPGIDEYLKLLDAAVAQAIDEQAPAEKVLQGVAEQWNLLTDRLGRGRQTTAYRKHLGLDDFNE